MDVDKLTERERQVFLSIVHGFIQTAEPVGSRYLSKHYNLNISPATVRNVMVDLEEMGLILQPHASAGRVPTDSGYRQYVNSMMGRVKLTLTEKRAIVNELNHFSRDVDSIVSKASEVLGNISSQLGVILAPRFKKGIIQKVDLVSISSDKVLFVIGIQSGFVKTVLVEIEQVIPDNLLRTVSEILNERLYGLQIKELSESLVSRFSDIDVKSKSVVDAIGKKVSDFSDFSSKSDFYFSGAKNVIAQPEFENKEKVGKILELLDRKDILIQILDDFGTEGISIVIGDENKEILMKNCSLIATTYQIDDVEGTIGVIGPTRMPYAKIVALVTFMAETLGCLVGHPK